MHAQRALGPYLGVPVPFITFILRSGEKVIPPVSISRISNLDVPGSNKIEDHKIHREESMLTTYVGNQASLYSSVAVITVVNGSSATLIAASI